MPKFLRKWVARLIFLFDSTFSYQIQDWLPKFVRARLFSAELLLQSWAQLQLDFFSEEELHFLQLRRLKKILVHAANTVPYWQNVFREAGLDPKNLKDVKEISRLSITTRSMLKSLPVEQFLSPHISPKRRVSATTSGSTGEPLSFFQDSYEILCRSAIALLAMRYGGFLKKKPVLVLGRGGPHLQLIGTIVSGAILESETFREKKFYPFLSNYRPRVVLGTASYLLRLAHHLKEDGITVPLHGLIATGEELRKEEREGLENFFKCPTGSIYATNECAVIGITCSYGKYHCLPFLNYVEVVDDRGIPCPDGKRGKITVTLFGNMVMPFIRYQIGDEGMIEGRLCRCGRKSKVITFTGRTPMYIQLGEKYINVRFLEFFLTDYCRGITKFQIIQENKNSIGVRYCSDFGSLPNENEIVVNMKKALRRHAGVVQEVRVSFERVNELLPNIRGKTPVFVSNAGN